MSYWHDGSPKCPRCGGHGYVVDENDNDYECSDCFGMGIDDAQYPKQKEISFWRSTWELFFQPKEGAE